MAIPGAQLKSPEAGVGVGAAQLHFSWVKLYEYFSGFN